MKNSDRIVIRGLRDVAAAETQISFVDPQGKLYYMGYNIDDIVDRVSYEEVVYLLLNRKLPDQKTLTRFKSQLVSAMEKTPDQLIERLKSAPFEAHPMEILRTSVSHLGEFESKPRIHTCETGLKNKRRGIRLIAQVPAIVAHFHRIRRRKPLVTPKKGLSFAENFLYMFRGELPTKEEGEIMDRYMILHADHGLNASTFASRVTAGTKSDMYSAITSAIGTLKGRLHGGASERVMRIFIRINNLEEVEDYIQDMLTDGKRIMGFGHRVYVNEDPRSKHLRKMCETLCRRRNQLGRYEKAKRIEEIVYAKKGIYPNVDFYASLVMTSLGIPKKFFTAFFASSRITGWVAHVMEQYEDNVLIRPTSKYTGEYGKKFIPIENR